DGEANLRFVRLSVGAAVPVEPNRVVGGVNDCDMDSVPFGCILGRSRDILGSEINRAQVFPVLLLTRRVPNAVISGATKAAAVANSEYRRGFFRRLLNINPRLQSFLPDIERQRG